MGRLKSWAAHLKYDFKTVWLAARDPRVPPMAKLLAGVVAAYALSPIDLIPDFIPVLGYLDDLILVPLGILAVLAMIPRDVLADLREQAVGDHAEHPVNRMAATAVLVIWLGLATALVWWLWPEVNHLFYPD